jgi:hypothetical protein
MVTLQSAIEEADACPDGSISSQWQNLSCGSDESYWYPKEDDNERIAFPSLLQWFRQPGLS